MDGGETRALARAAGVLLVLSAVRLGWSRARPPVETEGVGGDVLPGLLRSSHAGAVEAAERSRPLAPDERIDPNRAPAAQLDRLPGVGPALAGAIVEERERRGPFQRTEDLERVAGVGPSVLARIRPHLDLSRPPPPGPGAPSTTPADRTLGSFAKAPAPDLPGPAGAPTRRAPAPPPPPVDVNRADTTELQTLPGVGPVLARRIVESRRHAPFRSLEDLTRVKGIGPAGLARLRGRVRFGPGP